jgi:endonuclease/exonuclease/phosphatase family metal-dependent hydrolase
VYTLKASKFQIALKSEIIISHTSGPVTLGKASIIANLFVSAGGPQITIAIVGSHFECYDEHYEYRNDEWQSVVKELDGKSDYVIMMGDLNYRIEADRSQLLQLIEQQNYAELLSNDQLRRAQREHPELASFTEGTIEFAPTYKFDENSSVYDTSPKQRIPSYTDRILISRRETAPAPEFAEYRAIDDRISDHRPVRATINVPIPTQTT